MPMSWLVPMAFGRRYDGLLDRGADGLAASGAAGGALNEAEARLMAKDSILMASNANSRFTPP